MSDRDPAERWSELDGSTHPRARSRPAPEPTRLRKPAPPAPAPDPGDEPEPGPSPYESYPWSAVAGSPLSPTQPPFPVGPPYGVGPAYGVGSPYGQAPGYPLHPVRHPSASVALTLGLVGLVGGATCYVPLVASPFALVVGRRALREIDASLGSMTGRGAARAGAVLGGIGSAVLALALVALIVYLVA